MNEKRANFNDLGDLYGKIDLKIKINTKNARRIGMVR